MRRAGQTGDIVTDRHAVAPPTGVIALTENTAFKLGERGKYMKG
jgi:hypothetical protein